MLSLLRRTSPRHKATQRSATSREPRFESLENRSCPSSFSLSSQVGDKDKLDLGFFPEGTALEIQMSRSINLTQLSGTNWVTKPDGSIVGPVSDHTYSYATSGASNYPTVYGGDGINHFPGGGANYDINGPVYFGFAGKLTTDTTDSGAIRLGAVVGTFSNAPGRNDWFLIGMGTMKPVPHGGAHLYVAVQDTYYPNNAGSYDGLVIANQPDLVVTRPTWTPGQGVNFSYTISGADLTIPTKVGLYWSTDTTFNLSGPNPDTPAYGPIDTDTAQGTYAVPVNHDDLTTPPSTAQYLLAVVDPPDAGHPQGQIVESDETNNVQPLVLPNVAIDINDTPDKSDNITLFDPPPLVLTYTQTIPARITNQGGDGTFDLSVEPSGAATLSQTKVTLAAGASTEVTITPQAVSSAPYDVHIVAALDNAIKAGEDDMTIVSVAMPQHIRNVDTPAEMVADRIPPRVDTPVPVTVAPDLDGSGQSVTLVVEGQDPTTGFVKINGQDQYLLTSSAVLDLRGSSQTEPGFAGQLGLLVQARDRDTVRSEGFSVAAIPVGATVVFDSKITDPGFRGVVIALHWKSDSGDPSDLDKIGVLEQVQITEPATGSLQEIDFPNHFYVDNIAPPRLIVDDHATPLRDIRPSPRNRGDRVVVSQVFLFHDYRTGIDITKDIPVSNSGFHIIREVFRDTDHRWKLRTTVEGTDATANGFSSSAGTSLVVDVSTKDQREPRQKPKRRAMSNGIHTSPKRTRSPFSGLFIVPISHMSGDGESFDLWVHDNAIASLTSEFGSLFAARKKE